MKMGLFMGSSVPVSGWSADWAWGLPLIVGTVLFHIVGLGLIRQRTKRFSARSIKHRHPTAAFVIVMGTATLLATSLHGIEAGIWAVAYLGWALCRTSRRQSFFAGCNNKLRTCEFESGATLAPAGIDRGA